MSSAARYGAEKALRQAGASAKRIRSLRKTAGYQQLVQAAQHALDVRETVARGRAAPTTLFVANTELAQLCQLIVKGGR